MRDLNFQPSLYFDESIVNGLSDVKEILGDLSLLRTSEMLKLAAKSNVEFVKRYEAAFGTGPRIWADYAYDAVRLALHLKDKSPEQAREWLKENSYSGLSGEIEFDSVGLRRPEFSIIPLDDDPRFKSSIN